MNELFDITTASNQAYLALQLDPPDQLETWNVEDFEDIVAVEASPLN